MANTRTFQGRPCTIEAPGTPGAVASSYAHQGGPNVILARNGDAETLDRLIEASAEGGTADEAAVNVASLDFLIYLGLPITRSAGRVATTVKRRFDLVPTTAPKGWQ